MKRIYRLEFNEKQQQFHLDNGTHEPESNGWFTIADRCTETEFKIFESYVNKTKIKSFTKKYLLKSFDELSCFIFNLSEYNIIIKKNKL